MTNRNFIAATMMALAMLAASMSMAHARKQVEIKAGAWACEDTQTLDAVSDKRNPLRRPHLFCLSFNEPVYLLKIRNKHCQIETLSGWLKQQAEGLEWQQTDTAWVLCKMLVPSYRDRE
jgi:hypothetical protein